MVSSSQSRSAERDPAERDPAECDPAECDPAECDVVLQGGTASGVIYPRALAALAGRYRLRGIGGTSAGAMAAAVAAAAEYGRITGQGGFDGFSSIPTELGNGRLKELFQPTRETRPLYDILLAVTGGDRPDGRSVPSAVFASLVAAIHGYPLAAIAGVLPGLVLIIIGTLLPEPWAIVLGAVLLIIVEVVALLIAVTRGLAIDVPDNAFGICTGLTEPGVADDAGPALTEWLSTKINEAAGLPDAAPPLTFGQLWTADQRDAQDRTKLITESVAPDTEPRSRSIDLRMMTTCLSEARPYELPFSSSRFFYDRNEWQRIFPPEVMAALDAAGSPRTPADVDPRSWHADHDQAQQHSPGLRRLPAAEELPVIVAARLSLSMPLMISAVPLWVIERAEAGPDGRLDPTGPRRFVKVWFADGGLSNNFPVQLFDAALPTRPTYAINLQNFPHGVEPSPDEIGAVEWAHGNRDGLAPRIARWPARGLPAIAGFVSAIYTSSASWHNTTQLTFPGFRDRIVRVLQTPREGGLNLAMDDETIERLARRGEFAANAIMDQFELPHYPPLVDGTPTSTGWDNHRWVRFRALLSVLPTWSASYGRGRQVLDQDLDAEPPSYRFADDGERRLAADLDRAMIELARIVEQADPGALAALTAQPRPAGAIRRVPQI